MIEIARIVSFQSSPPEEAPGKITELLAHRLSAQRVAIWLFTPDHSHLFCCDLFDLSSATHHQGAELPYAPYNDFWAELGKSQLVSSNDISNPPPLSQTVSADFSTTTASYASIAISGPSRGLICIEHSATSKPWTQDEQFLIKIAACLPLAQISAQQHIHSANKLKQAVSLLSSILESVGEGIVVTTLDRRITRANHSLVELFGLPSCDWHSLVGSTVRAVLLPLVKNAAQICADADLLYENIERQAIHVIELKDGRTLERYSQPQRVEGQIIGRIFSFRDISARVRSEQVRVKLVHQLQQSQKMEALGTMASSIAHDFNNILNAVACNLNILRCDIPRGHTSESSLEDIGTAIRRAADLVGKILTFGRQKVLEPRQIELRPLLQDVVKFVRASVPASIDIRIQAENDLPLLYADPLLIYQLLLNLCLNASQAIGDRPGNITVQARAIMVTPDLISNNPELRIGNHMLLSVIDTGCGMDEATLDHIFEPFFTTKSSSMGTGLGLSIVHGIMRAHSGTIVVSSQPNQGTEFHLYFTLPETRQPIG